MSKPYSRGNLPGRHQGKELTRLSSSVHTRRAQSFTSNGSWVGSCTLTSCPSHQHLRCKCGRVSHRLLRQGTKEQEESTYSWFSPEKEQLLCSSHLCIVDAYCRLAQVRGAIVLDACLEQHKCDRRDTAPGRL